VRGAVLAAGGLLALTACGTAGDPVSRFLDNYTTPEQRCQAAVVIAATLGEKYPEGTEWHYLAVEAMQEAQDVCALAPAP
jgi:hypothetical protein